MFKSLSKGAGISLALVMAFFAQGIAPMSVAYANTAENSGQGPSRDRGVEKVKICHSTQPQPSQGNGQGPQENPYVLLNVDADSVDGDDGNDNGQGDHYLEHDGPVFTPGANYWGDIIPPVEGVHAGLNWTAAGRAIYYNNCNIPSNDDDHVAALAPIFVDQTCDAKGTYTIRPSTVYTYKVAVGDGLATEQESGTYEVTAPAKITITAYLGDDVWLQDGSPWTHMFEVPKCDDDQPGSGGVKPPVDQNNPTTPVTPSGASGVNELPTTGPGEMGILIALLAAAAAYGATYFAQPKRLYE